MDIPLTSLPPHKSQPTIIDGRYVLTSDPLREGGMSKVQKAFDSIGNRFVAIKRMKHAQQDDLRWKESFNREYAALSDLCSHPYIVKLYDAGSDNAGFYMVLEWVETNLADLVLKHGAMNWNEFYSSIGRPVLEAISFAQSRGWDHRDIKPQNVLISEDGSPRVSDYGIAKQFEKPAVGITFSSFRSAPFTPPEDDSGDWGRSRDCFSWAAVAGFCLTGSIPPDYGALAAAVNGISQHDVPIEILQTALSHDPSERPPLASALLAEVDSWAAAKQAREQPQSICYLQIDPDLSQRLCRLLDVTDAKEIQRQLIDELNEVSVGLKGLTAADGRAGLRISAIAWIFEAFPSPDRDRLIISRAWQSRPAEVERHREAGFRPPIHFSFVPPADRLKSKAFLDDLLLELEAFEAEERDRALVAQKDRIFRVWYAFLRAKADLEARRENAIPFTDAKIRDATVALVTELPAPVEIVGQSRVIRTTSGGHVFCDVIDVNLEEVVVSVTAGDSNKIPRRGKLEINTVAAEKAIERQRRALDAVNYNRAASPRLRTIITNPATNREPTVLRVPTPIGGGPFDPEKKDVLVRALGVLDILAIQGPPGTGKTRLIEEILVQYLALNPRHRVLLSAQTHVALDNVIERLRVRQPTIDIVRIGRLDDQKISPSCRDLILDRKAQRWAEAVATRARKFIAEWAQERGLNRADIEVGMLTERLILLLQRVDELQKSLRNAEARVQAVDKEAEVKLTETGTADSAELEVASVEAQQAATIFRTELSRARIEIDEVRSRLSSAGGYGADLASQASEDELREWSSMLLGEGQDQVHCRRLLELQEEWMLRVGRSSDFHAAMLASAQVVAGTCIGMAGVRGMGEVAYDLCIVDEASKATATEILVPMSRSRKWILVGDPEQLPPFFEDESITQLEEFSEDEVRETLLDRCLRDLPGHSAALLINQHRMVKPIGDLISHAFYKDQLNSPKTKPDVILTGAFPKPVTWVSTSDEPDGSEVRSGPSFRNEAECRVIRDILSQIDFVAKKRRATYDIALIAGYVAQVKALQDVIRDRLHEWTAIKIVCSTVDAFQGSEAEVCIYSVTRSNKEGRLGFLREKPRLNVALSRGRSALIIVGDDLFCRAAVGQNPFRKVLDFIEAHPDQCDRRRAR